MNIISDSTLSDKQEQLLLNGNYNAVDFTTNLIPDYTANPL